MGVEMEGAVAEHQLQRQVTRSRLEASGEEVDIGSFRDVAVDFAAGCVSGCASIVVGQPFDTVKVRVQTQDFPLAACAASGPPKRAAYTGAMACAAETVSREGPLALFKGMGTPLASAALINAISFGAYAQSQRVLAAYGLMEDRAAVREAERATGVAASGTEEELMERRNIGLVWSFVGGSFAGLCQAVVVLPTDNIKVKLQVQVGTPGSPKLQYRGPVDCALKLVRRQGVGALFRGTTATVIRDTPSFGLYFASYEGTKDWLERRWGLGEQASSFSAGGLAGALSWLVVYPFDVVKSVQQASTNPLDPSTRTMGACFRHIFTSAGGGVPGVKRLFRGVGTTLVRAVPVNAVIFPTFESTVRFLNKTLPPPAK